MKQVCAMKGNQFGKTTSHRCGAASSDSPLPHLCAAVSNWPRSHLAGRWYSREGGGAGETGRVWPTALSICLRRHRSARSGTTAPPSSRNRTGGAGARAGPFAKALHEVRNRVGLIDQRANAFVDHVGAATPCPTALLHKWSDGGGSPIPGPTYPTASVMGVPSAVKPFRTATRTWNSAT